MGRPIWRYHHISVWSLVLLEVPAWLPQRTAPIPDTRIRAGGAWSNYPFFRSGNVIVTSVQEGMFVLRPRRTVF